MIGTYNENTTISIGVVRGDLGGLAPPV